MSPQLVATALMAFPSLGVLAAAPSPTPMPRAPSVRQDTSTFADSATEALVARARHRH